MTRARHLAAACLGLWLALPLPLAAQSLQEARRLAGSGNHDAALAAVEALLEESPGDAGARLLRGVLLTRLGRIDDAVEHFRALIGERPELPEPYNNLAVLLAARGDYEGAREALVQAVNLQPDYHVAHENLGDVYTQLASQSYRDAAASSTDPDRLQGKATAAERVLEDIRLPPSPVPADTPPATTAATVPGCLAVDGLVSRERAVEVERWFQERGVSSAFERLGATGTATTYRVYVPPAENIEAATEAAMALRRSGVKDLMLIRSGELRNGISLGVFGSRANAERHAQRMSARGVQTRVATTGPEADTRYRVLTLSGATPPPDDAILGAFPESRVIPTACR